MSDIKTSDYYKRNASALFQKYRKAEPGISEFFPFYFSKGDKILDIGCSSGRDVLTLLNLGMDAYGVEPCGEMLELAVKQDSDLTGRVFCCALPELCEQVSSIKFNGILMSAIVMHLPDEILFACFWKVRELLVSGGKLVLSFPVKRSDLVENDRDEQGRLMRMRSSDEYELLLTRIGFTLRHKMDSLDMMGREGFEWKTLVWELTGTGKLRSIDRIESIISRDKKTSTYKYALLYSLCDVAMYEEKIAKFEINGKCSVPIQSIVKRWIRYYWPLVDNNIRQITGTTSLAFEKDLKLLICHYKSIGGYSLFLSDLNSGMFSVQLKSQYESLYCSIASAIIKGPVTYAGGHQGEQTFSYNSQTKSIQFDSSVWQEFVLMSHWIGDSILLRWAELTEKITNQQVQRGIVLQLLRQDDFFERDVQTAKSFYLKKSNLECVWSGKRLTSQSTHIDHAIPFSLWRDNSLWNLLPADAKVNGNKSDKLPSGDLLKKRRDPVIEYWKLLSSEYPKRFELEISDFCGKDMKLSAQNWETSLYSRFSEAIETTALARGVERWECRA